MYIMNILKYIINKVKVVNDCWVWVGDKWTNGYGRAYVAGKSFRAHRLLYEYWFDTVIPENIYACHSCDNKVCVNPYHIFLGTHSDNMKDAAKKGRLFCPKGSKNKKRIDRTLVLSYKGKLSGRKTAKLLNISENSVSRIWKST
jgi:hypothetical protein